MTANETGAEQADEAAAAETVGADELRELTASGRAELIDVRTEHEWRAGHLPGARHVRLDDLPASAGELPADREIIIYCRGGNRSAFAAEGLRQAGFEARALAGGALAWAERGLELEPEGGYVAESGEAAAELEARARSGKRPPGISY